MASRSAERPPAQRPPFRGTPLVVGLLLIVALGLLPSPWSLPVNSGASALVRGRLATEPTPPTSGYSGSVTVELLEGPAQGESVVAAIDQSEEVPGSIPFAKGDEVLLVDLGGESDGAKYAVADRSRGGGIG